MDASRWDDVQALFEAALDQPAAAREAFLRHACANDPALFEEVFSLLAADTEDHALLDGHAFDALGGARFDERLPGEPPDVPAGQRIGPYRIVRLLGAGGMGSVYLAERDDGQYQQQVALKLIKRGMDSDQVLRRFRAERQILARLQHEHIARLLDGGVTDDGRPYFAMAYVVGQPINAYCQARNLSVEARLQLFTEVCKAVQYAHHNLVVHRDLKPSNILVTEEGQVKLLDFGIAKVLAADDDDGYTRTAQRAMTPAYAAPEQVHGHPVTTATDVYALGILLYELLTGQRPYVLDSTAPDRMAEALSSITLQKPSTVVGRGLTISTPAPVVTGAQADRLRRRLQGDLDTICLKALRQEPERRYASAEQLAEDIRRHLVGLPVRARPDTLGYRSRKFAWRHRVGLSAAATMAAVVMTLVLFYTAQLTRERNRAQHEAAKAQQVATLMQDVFALADPSESRGETVTARELLDEGAVRVRESLAGQPLVQADMMAVIGHVYQRLGLLREAEPLLAEVVRLRTDHLGRFTPEVAEAQARLAYNYRQLGDYAQAEPLYRNALALQQKMLGPAHPEVGSTLRELGSLQRQLGQYEAAEDYYYRALAIQQQHYGRQHGSVTNTLNSLALLMDKKGDYDQAEQLYREALAGDRLRLGEDHPDVAVVMANLAYMLRRKGDLDAAEAMYREVLDLQRRLFQEDNLHTANTMRFLASVLRDRAQYDEAEALYLQALDLRRRLLPPDHPDIANTLNSLATLYVRTGNGAAAEAHYREAIAIDEAHMGPDHADLAPLMTNLAALLAGKESPAEAEAFYRRALAIVQKTLPADHPDQARPRTGLAALLMDQGRAAEAEPLLHDVLALRRTNRPEGHRYIGDAAGALGRCLLALGRYEAAEALLLESHTILQDRRGADHPQARHTQQALVDLYEAWGRPDQAAPYRTTESGP